MSQIFRGDVSGPVVDLTLFLLLTSPSGPCLCDNTSLFPQGLILPCVYSPSTNISVICLCAQKCWEQTKLTRRSVSHTWGVYSPIGSAGKWWTIMACCHGSLKTWEEVINSTKHRVRGPVKDSQKKSCMCWVLSDEQSPNSITYFRTQICTIDFIPFFLFSSLSFLPLF